MADRIIQMKDNQGNNLFPLVKISPSILEGNYLPITGGTLTGDLILKGDPTSLLMPATKQYVDNKFGNYLPLSGGTMTGTITSKTYNNIAINWRPDHNSYWSTVSYQTSGDEALVFANSQSVTSFIFISGEDSITNHANNRWYSLTSGIQMKSNCLNVGGLWGTGESPDYKLKVNGSSYFSDRINSADIWAIGSSARLVFRHLDGQNCNGDYDLYLQYYTKAAIRCTGKLYGAVWNDYAEYRKSDDNEPGRVVMEDKKGVLQRATERLQSFTGVVSDTFGFSEGETDEAKTPLAVAGRVLVYPYRPREEYNPGDCVCAAPDGTVDIMTRQEIRDWPDRIVGTVSEIPDYETWGTGNVEVNGRIWIKVR